jgi:hypothetical protein
MKKLVIELTMILVLSFFFILWLTEIYNYFCNINLDLYQATIKKEIIIQELTQIDLYNKSFHVNYEENANKTLL